MKGFAAGVGVVVKNNTILMEKLAPKKFTIAYRHHGDEDGNPLGAAIKLASDEVAASLDGLAENIDGLPVLI